LTPRVSVIGGGLAGSEATWQLAKRGVGVDLYEMRPVLKTPFIRRTRRARALQHRCAGAISIAAGILKEEMRAARPR
jgi:methylenetetrahydrofolate--tRNA-(uracil-5-)-methyltransferase